MTIENPSPRLFTVEEANALLPEIRQKVSQMRDSLVRVRAETERIRRESYSTSSGPAITRLLTESGIPTITEEVNRLIEDVHRHGCLVNGPEAGLVDFPCLLGAEIVFLCWKLGEPRVAHWHRIPDGFAGRRPLLDDGAGLEVVH